MPSPRAIKNAFLVAVVCVPVTYFVYQHLYFERVGPLLEPANHAYRVSTGVDECTDPLAAITGDEIRKLKTVGGTNFEVRVPANYRDEVRHPLLVVYAPGGSGRLASERLVSIPAAARMATGRSNIIV